VDFPRRGHGSSLKASAAGFPASFHCRVTPPSVTEQKRNAPESLELLNHTPFDPGSPDSATRLVDIGRSPLGKTTLKKHKPKTVRKNSGEGHQGRLAIKVRQRADLYRRIEG
jgi:hypothetical protein